MSSSQPVVVTQFGAMKRRIHLSCLAHPYPLVGNLQSSVLLEQCCAVTSILPLLQARLTYELAMANKDASSVDEAAAKDYDDRLSDDSSGESQHHTASAGIL